MLTPGGVSNTVGVAAGINDRSNEDVVQLQLEKIPIPQNKRKVGPLVESKVKYT